MTATSDRPDRPRSVAYPIAPLQEQSYEEVMTAPLGGDLNHYGSCADFCARLEMPPRGASVEEHGPWCSSPPLGRVTGHDEAGRRAQVFVSVSQLYVHGTYRRDDLVGRYGESYVELTIYPPGSGDGPDDGFEVFLTLGEGRRLAAQLVAGADVGDGLRRDFLSARARRERLS